MPQVLRGRSSPLAVALIVLTSLVASPLSAQTTKPAPKVMTLSGCVERRGSAPGQYTLSEGKSGTTYELTGAAVRDFVGRRVEIIGQAPRRFTIAGGLTPSANVAAQAGAMDPVRAAVASAGGSAGPGLVDLPEFRVKSVRPISGACGG
ncbi:MAG: hypothetical protein HYR75_00020 [Gemmatimonadetes bacterium]|nr:hypothetical protein [Gemmatimonadota bacterium]